MNAFPSAAVPEDIATCWLQKLQFMQNKGSSMTLNAHDKVVSQIYINVKLKPAKALSYLI